MLLRQGVWFAKAFESENISCGFFSNYLYNTKMAFSDHFLLLKVIQVHT